jgi:hypothetical protein
LPKKAIHGTASVGNRLITLAAQDAGDHEGSRRHYYQKRPVVKVKHTTPGLSYLQNAAGIYVDAEGYYYPIYDAKNGFGGCVDWSAPMFTRDLERGITGYDVYLLQKAFVLEVGFDPSDCIGIFGPKTAAAVIALQEKHHCANSSEGWSANKGISQPHLQPASIMRRCNYPSLKHHGNHLCSISNRLGSVAQTALTE